MEHLVNQINSGTIAQMKIIVVAVLIYTFIVLLRKLLSAKFLKIAQKTSNPYDDLIVKSIQKISRFTILAITLMIAIQMYPQPKILSQAIYIITLALVAREAVRFVRDLMDTYFTSKISQNKRNKTVFIAIDKIVSSLVIAIFLLIGLDALGVNVTSIMAGLGIGGIALALAIKNVLEDIVSSLSIYLDQPFSIGDFIMIGETKGTVKKIGLKSTILTAFDGAETVISNKNITSQNIENYGRLKRRLNTIILGVDYETSNEKLTKISSLIQKVINKSPGCEFHSSHLTEFGPSSIDYKILYYFDGNNYVDFVNSLEQINLKIIEVFRKEKINIPFQTITLKK